MTDPHDHTPPKNCDLCPRLHNFIQTNRLKFPDKFNAPVPPFGDPNAELLIVGLAPGLKGANFTSRPFTGDYAGDLLYGTLLKFGFARGEYKGHADDGLTLINTRITNAVKCVPPENKPTGEETNICMDNFLKPEIAAMPSVKIILSLGLISHNAVLKTFGQKQSAHKFAHGAMHDLRSDEGGTPEREKQKNNGLTLIDSYHCSRYNTQTKRLTTEMFEDIFLEIKNHLTSA